MQNGTPKEQLHHIIRREFTGLVTRYFSKRPQRINDPDTDDDIKSMLLAMENTLNALDCYEVHDITPKE